MNNTFNIGAMDTVYPFIPMYPNGQPQGCLLYTSAELEQQKEREALKEQFGQLVALAAAQVTGKMLTEEDQRRINREAVSYTHLLPPALTTINHLPPRPDRMPPA